MSELPRVPLGPLSVTRFIIGGNPFSGVSHQSAEATKQMIDYFCVVGKPIFFSM